MIASLTQQIIDMVTVIVRGHQLPLCGLRAPHLKIWSTFFHLVVMWLTERTSVCLYKLRGRGWETKKGKGGESRECSFEVWNPADGRIFLVGNFCATCVYPTDLCHFWKWVFTISNKQRDEEQERAQEKRQQNLRNLSWESLERSQGRRRREIFNEEHH